MWAYLPSDSKKSIPSNRLTFLWKITHELSMTIFNSYVELPEGMTFGCLNMATSLNLRLGHVQQLYLSH